MTPGVPVAFVALFGLLVGSFLNVCIHRLPQGESIVWPASRCPSCHHSLSWFENVPVLSYLALRGRCRTCGVPISLAYPLVETITALVFVAVYLSVDPGWVLLSRILFAAILIVLFTIDLEHHILPNVITLPGVIVGVGFSLLGPPGWKSALIGVVAGGGVLLLIAEGYYRLRGEEGLGMGDVKMLAMIGAFLGWPLMLVTLVLSSLLGSLVGVAMVALRKGDLKYALPFGSFLAIGALAATLVGDRLLAWYLGFYS